MHQINKYSLLVHFSSTMYVMMADYHHSDNTFQPHLLQISNMPDKVTKRYWHSISAVGVSDGCIWVMVTGGNSIFHDFADDVALLELSE